MINLSRRGFIFGAAAFSIVRPEIIMPVKSIIVVDEFTPLPEGEYSFFFDELSMMNNRLLAKMIVHGQNYGMGKPRVMSMGYEFNQSIDTITAGTVHRAKVIQELVK